MTTPEVYVLDSNVFIQAARGYYAFDIAPTFWSKLIDQAKSSRVKSIDRVQAETDREKDPLADWANTNFHQWFAPTDQADVIETYGQLIVWAHSQTQFTDAAKAEFSLAENADAWVVAYAKANGCVVVTLEQFNPDIKRRIPIPNVCQAFDVPYLDTFQMLLDLAVKL